MTEHGPFSRERRRARFLLAGIIALAFALRVVHVWLMRANPGFAAPTMDALYHVEWARAFAAGQSFQEGPFFRAPLYPWFLGALFRLFGDGLLAPRLVQAALGALTTAATYLVARRAFERTTALVASLLVATNWVLVYFDGEFLIPTLIVPLNLLALWLSLCLAERPTAKPAFGAGLLWGLSCIARPNPLLFLPFLAVWIARCARRARSSVLRPLLALTAGVALPILPITLYNASQGDRVLISTQAGVNFWIGNNPGSDGSSAIVPGTRADWWGGYHDTIALAERAEGRELRASEVSRHYFGRALEWMRSEPGAFLRLLRWKLHLFVLDWELGNNQDVRFFAERFGIAPWLPPGFGLFGGFGLLLGLAVVGLGVGLGVDRRGSWARFPLWGFLAVYSLGIVAFFVCSRYRAPIVPLLAVYAAHGLVWIARSLRSAPLRALGAAVLAAIVVIVSTSLPASIETSDANGYLQLSNYAQDAGHADEAIEYARTAVAADADNRLALRQLGVLLVNRGHPEEALAPLREAVRLADQDVDNLLALSAALRESGAVPEALTWAQRAAQVAPHLPGPYAASGRAHYRAEQWHEAARAFAEALERDPESFDLHVSHALALERGGRAEAATSSWERAVQLREQGQPEFVDLAYRALIAGLRRQGREAEAARLEAEHAALR